MPNFVAEPGPGTLLVAPASEGVDAVFGHSVVLVFDREPNGIIAGLVINRPLEQRALESSALALLFVPEPSAPAFWGGPMGDDPLILAQFTARDGLDYYHLPIRRRRPFVLPDVGLIAVAEHADAFDGRIRRARLFVGMCVWERGQLEAEIDLGAWHLAHPTADDLFTPDPAGLWARLQPPPLNP
jgi:putative transcriptional regulator